jgi:hypothetical protein
MGHGHDFHEFNKSFLMCFFVLASIFFVGYSAKSSQVSMFCWHLNFGCDLDNFLFSLDFHTLELVFLLGQGGPSGQTSDHVNGDPQSLVPIFFLGSKFWLP